MSNVVWIDLDARWRRGASPTVRSSRLMPDRRFEIDLDRWFGEAPAFADSDVFALRVEARLDRGWSFRQFLIGGLGVVGGLILVAQILGSGVAGRLNAVTAES